MRSSSYLPHPRSRRWPTWWRSSRPIPGTVAFGGGSAGGTDHILAGLVAKAAGGDVTKLNYVPFSGGGEALAAVMGGHVVAGISGYSEWAGQIESGELRALGDLRARAPGRVSTFRR